MFPTPLKAVLDKIVNTSYADIAKDRTQAMRKWLLRAQELRDVDPPFETPPHCREVLKNKSMTLFAEMLAEADYPDKTLVRTMCSGFDLLGQIPESSVLPKKHTDALLAVEEIRSLTPDVRAAILQTANKGSDPEIAYAVHQLTLEEREIRAGSVDQSISHPCRATQSSPGGSASSRAAMMLPKVR